MPPLNLSVKHGQTWDVARAHFEKAIEAARTEFGMWIQRVEWSADRSAVTVGGGGFVVEMKVDPQEVHVSGDIPVLGALFGRSMESGVKQIVQKTFGKG